MQLNFLMETFCLVKFFFRSRYKDKVTFRHDNGLPRILNGPVSGQHGLQLRAPLRGKLIFLPRKMKWGRAAMAFPACVKSYSSYRLQSSGDGYCHPPRWVDDCQTFTEWESGRYPARNPGQSVSENQYPAPDCCQSFLIRLSPPIKPATYADVYSPSRRMREMYSGYPMRMFDSWNWSPT